MRRVAFYLFYDFTGQVDDYVLHTLEHLRPHVDHVFVVSNSPLDDVNRARLVGAADTVWERENVGLDVWAYKTAMEQFGTDRLQDFDELILMNSTFFGPMSTFDDLFAGMESRELDFWGITEHGFAETHPFDHSISLPAHLQSHWLAVRRRMFTSGDWAEYWGEMPMIKSYRASVTEHESRFTSYFEERGYSGAAAFPASDYDTSHPVMNNVLELLRDGCPIVKRRSFFHNPMYNEHFAVDGRRVSSVMTDLGYPFDLALRNLARTSKPRALATNLGLLEVLPDVDLGYDRERPLRVVAVAHIFYPDMTDEIVDRLDHLPDGYDLVITTSDDEKRVEISKALAERGRPADVRVVGSNRGRDISAFLVDCRDVIESDDYDLLVKVHSKKNLQDSANIAELFKRHLFEGLLSSPGYAANVVRLFQQQPTLGMVFPPIYHIAYPTLGHSWFLNKARAQQEAARLGIGVPFDDTTPLASYGSMFIARPEALRPIAAGDYTYDDFPDESGYGDGALTHVLERLMSYSVLSTGHHVREVMSADLVATSYSYLEYRAIAIGELLPAYPSEQIRKIKHLKRYKAARRPGGAKAERAKGAPKAARALPADVHPEPPPQPKGRLARLVNAWHAP